jgi:hypothetical protein
MYMRDGFSRLDDFLKVRGREVPSHAGKIRHEKALEKAHAGYEQYRQERLNEPSPVERQFLEALRDIKQIEKKRTRRRKD